MESIPNYRHRGSPEEDRPGRVRPPSCTRGWIWPGFNLSGAVIVCVSASITIVFELTTPNRVIPFLRWPWPDFSSLYLCPKDLWWCLMIFRRDSTASVKKKVILSACHWCPWFGLFNSRSVWFPQSVSSGPILVKGPVAWNIIIHIWPDSRLQPKALLPVSFSPPKFTLSLDWELITFLVVSCFSSSAFTWTQLWVSSSKEQQLRDLLNSLKKNSSSSSSNLAPARPFGTNYSVSIQKYSSVTCVLHQWCIFYIIYMF